MSFNNYSMNGTSIPCPCEGCKKRHLGCHDNCEGYKQFKDELDKAKGRVFGEKQKHRLGGKLRQKK